MRRIALLALFVILVSPPVLLHRGTAQESGVLLESSSAQESTVTLDSARDDLSISPQSLNIDLESQLEGPLDTTEIVAADQFVSSLGLAEWLGPLAPVALSPFFGVTCLSGLSLWGPDWVAQNAMIGTRSALRSEMLFYIVLGLTILTSVPRFTKVSKPFAQAVDRLEAYSVIVILLAVKFSAASHSPEVGEVVMAKFGVIGFTMDTLLAIAMIINVLVINSVKFFFEFMVWLTPVPLLDAFFEVCNKSLCAVLIAIYAFSPTVATIINLTFLFLGFMIVKWVGKRVRFYRTIILDPILAWAWRPYSQPRREELIVFPKAEFGPFPAKSRLRLRRSTSNEAGWTLQEASWWRPDRSDEISGECKATVHAGWVMNRIDFTQRDGTLCQMSFSRRYGGETLRKLIEALGMQLSDEIAEPSNSELQHEFA